MNEQKKAADQEESLELLKKEIDGRDSFRPEVSPAVIKRLPRYFRYLRELIRMGKTRVSSAELSRMMNVTASQIRQDLNCFGGFGQQGYGYNVNYLYTKICEILGVGFGFRAAVIGAGNLGSALVRSPMFEKRGVDVVAMFDVSRAVIGKKIGNVKVYPMEELEARMREFSVDIAILTLPKERAVEVARQLTQSGVHGVWNFTGKELELGDCGIVVENVHMGDSLMTLCYEVAQKLNDTRKDSK
ncbi:MAG: redox-sensing transcriptional repressor Rex [Clostridia bacterium]|nr:redox-sensing transcriptional repressor Rex [Clostridia bacterium]